MAPPPSPEVTSPRPQASSESSESSESSGTEEAKRSVLERLLGAPLTCAPVILVTLALADSLSTLSLYIPYTHLPSAVQVL